MMRLRIRESKRTTRAPSWTRRRSSKLRHRTCGLPARCRSSVSGTGWGAKRRPIQRSRPCSRGSPPQPVWRGPTSSVSVRATGTSALGHSRWRKPGSLASCRIEGTDPGVVTARSRVRAEVREAGVRACSRRRGSALPPWLCDPVVRGRGGGSSVLRGGP